MENSMARSSARKNPTALRWDQPATDRGWLHMVTHPDARGPNDQWANEKRVVGFFIQYDRAPAHHPGKPVLANAYILRLDPNTRAAHEIKLGTEWFAKVDAAKKWIERKVKARLAADEKSGAFLEAGKRAARTPNPRSALRWVKHHPYLGEKRPYYSATAHGGAFKITPFPMGGWTVKWADATHEARVGNFSTLPLAKAAAARADVAPKRNPKAKKNPGLTSAWRGAKAAVLGTSPWKVGDRVHFKRGGEVGTVREVAKGYFGQPGSVLVAWPWDYSPPTWERDDDVVAAGAKSNPKSSRKSAKRPARKPPARKSTR